MLRLLMQADELIPEDVKLRAGQVIDTVKADPILLAILIGVGVLTLGIFLWGITKQFFKAALFAGLASVGVWYWYFNIR